MQWSAKPSRLAFRVQTLGLFYGVFRDHDHGFQIAVVFVYLVDANLDNFHARTLTAL